MGDIHCERKLCGGRVVPYKSNLGLDLETPFFWLKTVLGFKNQFFGIEYLRKWSKISKKLYVYGNHCFFRKNQLPPPYYYGHFTVYLKFLKKT